MSRRVLIKGGCVLTLGERTPNYPEADVLVSDGKIVEVARGIRARDAEQIDASGAIVMPGFVDTHRHAWKSLFRNSGDGDVTGAFGPHLSPDDAYVGTLIGLLGAVEAGITTVVDWSDILSTPAHTEAVLQAHAESGLRTVLVYAPPPWSEASPIPGPDVQGTALTTLAHGPSDAGPDWELARAAGLRSHVHILPGLVSRLDEGGLLDQSVTAVVDPSTGTGDLDLIVARGARVSLTPSADMAAGLGSPPIQELIDRGIRPGLGIGDETSSPGDIFVQMRAVNSIQHANTFDLKLAGKAGLRPLLGTREVIRYATSDGAGAAGLQGVTGSLEPGKQADIVVLRVDRPNIHPVNDPIGAVVWGMDTSNVDFVLVGGSILVRGGEFSSDIGAVRALATTAQLRLTTSGGVR